MASEAPTQPGRADLPAQLDAGDNASASLAVDVDAQGRFAETVLRLARVGAQGPARLTVQSGDSAPQALELGAGDRLELGELSGLASLSLLGPAGLRARWRLTLGRLPQAQAFLQAFEARDAAPPTDAPTACPACGAGLPPDREDCPACGHGAEDEEAPPASTWVLLRLGRFARPYRRQLALGFGLTLASTAATLIPPYLTIPLMDEVLIPHQNGQAIDPMQVALLLGGLLLSALAAWGLGWARTYVLALVSERIGADLRTTTFEHLLTLSLEYFGGKRTGDLMARIGSETDRINVFLSLHALDFATDVLMMLMTASILLSIHPGLALVTLLPLPAIAWLIHRVRERLRTGFERIDRVWGEVTNVLADTIPGIRVVKAFAQEGREAQRFHAANAHNLAVNDKLNKTWSLFSPTVGLMTEVGLLIVWACGIWLVAGDAITVGVLTAFIAYIGRFYARLDSMSRIVSVTQKAASGAKRIFDILDHVSNVPDPAEPRPLARPVQGRLTLRGLGFRYGARRVIRRLDLDIRPGEMIGLVGHSGSGKSTLVNLICRFYDVSEGAIELDGCDIRQHRLADYRSQIGLVLQEPFLFFGTVAENIAYGRPDASRAEIVAAARAAHAHDFILRLPQGYDSIVGERGQGLSGGERQRISIARALLIDPKILILDEATSAVDTETEKEIQKALDNLVQGRTTLAIAHRLSTLRKADRIVVMDRGEIVEVGPHAELIARGGAYWRLHEAQARREDAGLDRPQEIRA